MFLGCCSRLERPKITALAGFWILLARIQAVFSCAEFSDHRTSLNVKASSRANRYSNATTYLGIFDHRPLLGRPQISSIPLRLTSAGTVLDVLSLLLPDYIDRDLDRWNRSSVLKPVCGVPILGPAHSRPIVGIDSISVVSDCSL